MGLDFCDNATKEEVMKRFPPRDMNVKPLYIYLCPIMIFICFFSIIFNAILISISRQSKVVNKSPILLLSLNLAVTDLIASLFNGLGILFNSYLPEVYDIKMTQCYMLTFEVVRCAALVASALHLLALAFVHYRGIVNPLHYRSTIFFSQHLSRTINIISIACWIIPLTIMIAWFSSSPCQGFQSAECDYLFLLGFTYRYTVLTLFALPLLLMSVIYVRIFIIISRHQKGRRLNHERSTLSRGVLSATGPIGTAAAVNLPELIAKTDTARVKCAACAAKALNSDYDRTVSILSDQDQITNNYTDGKLRLDYSDQEDNYDDEDEPDVVSFGASSQSDEQDNNNNNISTAAASRTKGSVSNWSQSSVSRCLSFGNRDVRSPIRLKVGPNQAIGDREQEEQRQQNDNHGSEMSDSSESRQSVDECRRNNKRQSIVRIESRTVVGSIGVKSENSIGSSNIAITKKILYTDCDKGNGKNQHVGLIGDRFSEKGTDVSETGDDDDDERNDRVLNGDLAPDSGRLGFIRLFKPKTTSEISRPVREEGLEEGRNGDGEATGGTIVAQVRNNAPDEKEQNGGLEQHQVRNDLLDDSEINEVGSKPRIAARATKTVSMVDSKVLLKREGKEPLRGVSSSSLLQRDQLKGKRAGSCKSSGDIVSLTSSSTSFRRKAALRAQFSSGAAGESWSKASSSSREVQSLTLSSGKRRPAQRKPLQPQLANPFPSQTLPQQQQQQQTDSLPSRECTCDNKSRQFNSTATTTTTTALAGSKLSRSNTIGIDNDNNLPPSRPSSAATATIIQRISSSSSSARKLLAAGQLATSNVSPRSSISSAAPASFSLKTHIRRSLTSASGGSQSCAIQSDFRSAAATTSGASAGGGSGPNFATTSITGGGHGGNLTGLSSTTNYSTYEPQRRHLHASAVPQTNTKALVTTLLILGTYFISYVPAIIYQVLTCIDGCPYPLHDWSFSRRIQFGALTNFLLIAKSIIDPFIYSYRMSEIQIAIGRYFSKRRSKSSMGASMQASQRFNNSQSHQGHHHHHHHHHFKVNQQNQPTNKAAERSIKILNGSNKNKNNNIIALKIGSTSRPSNQQNMIADDVSKRYQSNRDTLSKDADTQLKIVGLYKQDHLGVQFSQLKESGVVDNSKDDDLDEEKSRLLDETNPCNGVVSPSSRETGSGGAVKLL